MSAKHGPMGAYERGTNSQSIDSAALLELATSARIEGTAPAAQHKARNQGTAHASRLISLPMRKVVPRRTAAPPMPCIKDTAPPASPKLIWCERTRKEGIHHNVPNA